MEFLRQNGRWIWRVVMILGLLIAGGGAVLAYLGQEAGQVEARPEIASHLWAGEPFDLRLDVRNVAKGELELVSIGLDMAGISVVETVPSFRKVESSQRWTEYIFSRQQRPVLQAGESIRLRVRMEAAQAGTYQGELVLWYNNQLQSDRVALEVTVHEHPAPWLGR